MIAFCDLPECERFRLRDAIEEHGGYIATYDGDGVQISMPRDYRAFCDKMCSLGLVRDAGSTHLFPLGTDNPPESLRHDGSYPGSRAFWMTATFYVPNFILF